MTQQSREVLKKFVESQIEFVKKMEHETKLLNCLAVKNEEIVQWTNNVYGAFSGKYNVRGKGGSNGC